MNDLRQRLIDVWAGVRVTERYCCSPSTVARWKISSQTTEFTIPPNTPITQLSFVAVKAVRCTKITPLFSRFFFSKISQRIRLLNSAINIDNADLFAKKHVLHRSNPSPTPTASALNLGYSNGFKLSLNSEIKNITDHGDLHFHVV